jgi:CheY-like chemotaxis protein
MDMAKTILIVDDEPGVTHTVKYGLEGLDDSYKVIAVDSGEKCLEFLENNQIPDLILLDIMMPEMNGWEVQKRLQGNINWKNIPIIFLTATADPTSKKIGEMSSEGFIEKPCKIPELKQKIDEILKR